MDLILSVGISKLSVDHVLKTSMNVVDLLFGKYKCMLNTFTHTPHTVLGRSLKPAQESALQ
jgi:hypothetical protein